jgi:endonuclease YncB( thermonuclease family)
VAARQLHKRARLDREPSLGDLRPDFLASLGITKPYIPDGGIRSAFVRHISDGDTFTVEELSVGWGVVLKNERIRIKGYFAPELKAPGGPEARQFLITLFELFNNHADLYWTGRWTYDRRECIVWWNGHTIDHYTAHANEISRP